MTQNFVLGKVHTLRTGDHAGNQHFLLFPKCFQKDSSIRVIKSQDCVVKGDTVYQPFKKKGGGKHS